MFPEITGAGLVTPERTMAAPGLAPAGALNVLPVTLNVTYWPLVEVAAIRPAVAVPAAAVKVLELTLTLML